MKLYGTATYYKAIRAWEIECEAHVAIRLKRWLPKIDSSIVSKKHRLKATPENCLDLQIFLQRYPMDVRPSEHFLEERAAEHKERMSLVDRFLRGEGSDKKFELKLPPREYQALAASMWLTTGGLLLADDVGLGKAQPLPSLILTPKGWAAMGDLKIGHEIVDPDTGVVAYVQGIYPKGKRKVYRVTTKDGASTLCCGEHLWTVQNSNDRVRGGWRTLTTEELIPGLKQVRGNGNLCSGWFLPITKPVDLSKAEIPIPPYLLGCLLGDGIFRKDAVGISNAQISLLQSVSALLPDGVVLRKVKSSKYDYRISGQKPKPNPLLDSVRGLGLGAHRAWEKFIPDLYKFCSIEQRRELLAGLLDTDAECRTDGTILFSSSSRQLADDVEEIVGLLGGFTSRWERTPTYRYRGVKKRGRTAYVLNIRVPFNPFKLEYKRARWHAPLMARAIDSIEEAGFEETQCIKVSSQRGLYVTDGFIVTHNTCVAFCGFIDPKLRPALVVTLSHLPFQWQSELQKFTDLKCHILKKGTPYDILDKDGKLPDVIISNYHKLPGWAQTLEGIVKSVTFDECQELRHEGTQKYEAAELISKSVDYRLGLSATPIYNYGGEIWNVCNIITPDALGNWEEFSREWCDYRGGKQIIGDPAAFGVSARETGVMLRRTRKEVKRELPGVIRVPQWIQSDPEAFKKLKGQAIELAKLILRQAQDFKGQKMQAAGEFDMKMRMMTGISKAPYVADFVRFLVEENGTPVVLYGWHRDVYEIWLEKLRGSTTYPYNVADLNPVMYTGTESPTQKEAAKQAFLSGKSKVMLISLRAGAGMDGLQDKCHVCVFGELDWSPGVHEQCEGRLHRDGQDEPVTSYYLLTDEGSDPVVSDVLGVKKQQIEGIRDPNQALVQQLQIDPDHIKKLAEKYLTDHGIPIPTPKVDDPDEVL